jgi:hypothetical protein
MSRRYQGSSKHYLFQNQFPYPTAWQHRQRTRPERISNNTVTPRLSQSVETNENQTFPKSEEWEDEEPKIGEVFVSYLANSSITEIPVRKCGMRSYGRTSR